MKITDGEKLILLMLSELYDTLKIDGKIEPDFIRLAIFNDKIWSIPWKYSGIPFENRETPEIVREVLEILDMWSVIEFSYDKLIDEDKAYVEKEADPFGKEPKFRGFDGNNEADYMGTASFVVNQLNRFEEFKGRDFNSHHPSIDIYKRMLCAYKPMMKDLYKLLSSQDIVEILKETTHPDNR